MRLLAAALLLAAPAMARPAPQVPAATNDDRAALARAAARGTLIYAYDQAAWHGTDDMIARMGGRISGVGGWVVEGSAESPRAIFFDSGGTRAVYTARFERGRLVEGKLLGADADATLSPDTGRLVAALKAARAAIAADRTVFNCADKPFNTVVLPPETPGGPTAVYFLTPQTQAEAYPIGGHYRVEVDAAGRAGPVRAFTRACLPMDPRRTSAAGAGLAALAVSHLLDPIPTELHVFASLTLHLPIYVITEKPAQRIWAVEGSRIRGPLSAAAAP